MTHRVGTKGQVVIPKDIRDRLGLKPGVSVDFIEDLGGVRLRAKRGDRGLAGRYARSGMADRLLTERTNEPR